MSLKVAIIGLPNVGKSTLFNALLKRQAALTANYPFATIEPNVGVVEVPDDRLPALAKVVKTQKIVPAIVEFYDIAGLVKGASKGEGLGNQFLSHIREVSAIVHVVRLFEDKDIINTQNSLNPQNDIQIIDEELALADLQTLEKQKEPKGNASKEELAFYKVVVKVREQLDKGVAVGDQKLSPEDKENIRKLNLLTSKPVIFLFNCSLEQLDKEQETKQKVEQILNQVQNDNPFLLFNPLDEKALDELIKKAYETLGLISFLTAGEKEVRAWTIKKSTDAKHAAGEIHTDFIQKFIKAEVVTYNDFTSTNGWTNAREQGKVRLEGKDYIIKDGDVIDFKIAA